MVPGLLAVASISPAPPRRDPDGCHAEDETTEQSVLAAEVRFYLHRCSTAS